MTLKQKLEYKSKNWSFAITYYDSRELLLSNDGKYLFHCKYQLGNSEADNGNLHQSL